MIARFSAVARQLVAALGNLVSDRQVTRGHVEMRIAVAQVFLIGIPFLLIGVAIMAMLP